MARPGAFTASDKRPAPEKLKSLCRYTTELLELRHSCTYTCACREHAQINTRSYNDGSHCECMTNYGVIHVNFIQNVSHVRFFSSRVCEFRLGKFLLKLRVHHSGKFIPRENNLLYGIMYRFADDSKYMHIIRNFNDTVDFQDGFNSVYHWSQTWNLKYNLSNTVLFSLAIILQVPLTIFTMALEYKSKHLPKIWGSLLLLRFTVAHHFIGTHHPYISAYRVHKKLGNSA